MLRRQIQREAKLATKTTHLSAANSDDSRVQTQNKVSSPLGAKKRKRKDERLLEQIVLGTDEQLIDKLGVDHGKTTGKKQTKVGHVKKKKNRTGPKPAWRDNDDADLRLDIPPPRGHQARSESWTWTQRTEHQTDVTGREYAQKLKNQFEKVAGAAPTWAKLRWERDDGDKDGSDDDEGGALLRSTGTYLGQAAALPRGTVSLKRCANINEGAKQRCRVDAVQFHPSAQVILTAGRDHCLNIYEVNGQDNPRIQRIVIEEAPITSACFAVDGTEVIIGVRRGAFHYYDMIAGRVVAATRFKGIRDTFERLRVSPDGRIIVCLGKFGYIHLISAVSKEYIGSVKTNGEVSAVAFSENGDRMYSHGDDGEVYVWDMTTRDCIHRFVDDGCISGTAIAASKDGRYIATGARSGVVNVYDSTCLTEHRPTPLKALMNLTTPCSSLVFNSSTEMLAIASDQAIAGARLVHLPSLNVFSNFPEFTERISTPVCLDFSVNGGYFAIGNTAGKALLYRVKHYKNY